MARRGKTTGRGETKANGPNEAKGNGHVVGARGGLPAGYWKACELAREGRYEDARAAYLRRARGIAKGTNPRLRALVQNDLAVLDAMQGKFEEACEQWRGVVEADETCLPARLNFGLIRAEMSFAASRNSKVESRSGNSKLEVRNPHGEHGGEIPEACEPRPVRVAVLSLLFNWPSTGGGNMYTAGLVEFLGRDGFDVRHFFARYEPWGIGRDTRQGGRRAEDGGKAETFGQGDDGVGDPRRTPRSERIDFSEGEWNVASIRERFRAAVDAFAPDYVVISDTWNMKPHLAEAMRSNT